MNWNQSNNNLFMQRISFRKILHYGSGLNPHAFAFEKYLAKIESNKSLLDGKLQIHVCAFSGLCLISGYLPLFSLYKVIGKYIHIFRLLCQCIFSMPVAASTNHLQITSTTFVSKHTWPNLSKWGTLRGMLSLVIAKNVWKGQNLSKL